MCRKSLFVVLPAALLPILIPEVAAAAVLVDPLAHADSVIDSICNIIRELEGPIARGVAAFGIVFLGFSMFLGKISWGTGLALGIGLALTFRPDLLIHLMEGVDPNNVGDKYVCAETL